MKLNTPVISSAIEIIYTMRHFESIGNAVGLGDQSLANKANHRFKITEKGKQQSILSARYISADNILCGCEFYTSGFLRAQESLDRVLKFNNYSPDRITEGFRLDEWWRGIFHSLSAEEIGNHYPLERKIQEREGKHHYRPPQGQAGKEVEINLISFLESVKARKIFISGHGRNLGFLRRILTNQPTDLNCNYPIPANGEIWKFSRER